MRKYPEYGVKTLIWASIVSCLLIILCSSLIYTNIANANSNTISFSLKDQVERVSPNTVSTLTPTPSNQSSPQPNASDYLLQLISGLIGAIIGAVIGVLGTIYATRSQIKAIYSQEKENRDYADKRQKEAIRNSLLVEIQENLDLVNAKDRKVHLSTEAWSTYKGNIAVFSASLQEELIKLYAKAKRYNSVLEQVSAMYLNKMDNEPLFPIQEKMEEQLVNICSSVLKKLAED